jgi:amino acid transporter
LVLQGLFACGLILVFGRDKLAFERLFNFAIFGMWGFYGITALAVLVLGRRQPFALPPSGLPGYPWVPLCFVAVAAAFCCSMLIQRPQETSLGIALLVGGLPFYWFWQWGPGNARQRNGSRRC